MPNPHKYYKTMGELIDHYVPFDDNEPYAQALIHAYELGAKHYSEQLQRYFAYDEGFNMCNFRDIEYSCIFELAEFDSNSEQEVN